MPLPMIHFEVAVRLFEDRDIPPPFLLGSIAPDAIHMMKNTNREDKKRTHLGLTDGESVESVKEIYEQFLGSDTDLEWKWFVRGYFAHVLTDYFWLDQVYYKFKEAIAAEQLTREEVTRTYYSETDQIDFNLYKHKHWRDDVWNKLIHVKSPDIAPLLSSDEINFWRFRVIHWFDLISKEPNVTPRYITESKMETFVADTAEKLKEIIGRWDNDFSNETVRTEEVR